MGNDTALAVLSEKPQILYSYFKQLFAQVTNPPVDAIREEIIMAAETATGPEGDRRAATPAPCPPRPHPPPRPAARRGEAAPPRAARRRLGAAPPPARGDAHPHRHHAGDGGAARGAPLRAAHRLRRERGEPLPRLRDHPRPDPPVD